MTTWFTADTHFGHANIIKYSSRGFSNVEEMDGVIIERWNSFVRPGDTVWHLGDFSWARKPEKAKEYLSQLTGQVHLILGNHDAEKVMTKVGFASVDKMRHIKIGEQEIVLCHYAMRVWRKNHYGAWHLYGHSHGTLIDDPFALSLDVGVDAWGLYPVSFEQVQDRMKRKKFVPVDHHRGEPGEQN